MQMEESEIYRGQTSQMVQGCLLCAGVWSGDLNCTAYIP